MSLLTNGNLKLSRDVGCWSISPALSCGGKCLGCYAVRAYNRYPKVRKKWDANYYESLNTEAFISRVVKEIEDKEFKIVRIHVAGDFYSEKYADAWATIAIRIPEVKFYGYTKYSKALFLNRFRNINIINSIVPEILHSNKLNYGTKEEMQPLIDYGYKLCPYRKDTPKHSCMDKDFCQLCLTKNCICFLEH